MTAGEFSMISQVTSEAERDQHARVGSTRCCELCALQTSHDHGTGEPQAHPTR